MPLFSSDTNSLLSISNLKDNFILKNQLNAHILLKIHFLICLTFLFYFRQLCRDALKGEHCSKKCNKSIDVLSKQTDGIQVKDCDCDTYHQDLCLTEKNNVLKTCFDIELKLSNYDIDSREVYLISSLNSTHNQIVINNNGNDLFQYELLLLIICLIMAFL